jgi:hypothetical protein
MPNLRQRFAERCRQRRIKPLRYDLTDEWLRHFKHQDSTARKSTRPPARSHLAIGTDCYQPLGDTMHYKIRKSLLGKYEVHFACQSCGESVINPIADAGTEQACPHCGTSCRVPGEKEKQQQQEARFLAEEADRKGRVDEQRKRERERTKAVEQEAAKRLQASMHAQQMLADDQDAIRTADWADRLMWRAFAFLRRAFAVQVFIGLMLMILGAVLLVIAIILYVGQLSKSSADYSDALRSGLAGLQCVGMGYGLYVLAAMCATIVYIERNTRGILRS